jgi:hypothetical protein
MATQRGLDDLPTAVDPLVMADLRVSDMFSLVQFRDLPSETAVNGRPDTVFLPVSGLASLFPFPRIGKVIDKRPAARLPAPFVLS